MTVYYVCFFAIECEKWWYGNDKWILFINAEVLFVFWDILDHKFRKRQAVCLLHISYAYIMLTAQQRDVKELHKYKYSLYTKLDNSANPSENNTERLQISTTRVWYKSSGEFNMSTELNLARGRAVARCCALACIDWNCVLSISMYGLSFICCSILFCFSITECMG